MNDGKASLPAKEQDQKDLFPARTSFFIVGIGASAGGLEAFGDFLKNIPPNLGMAFIFVQHLAPDHASLLANILSKKTAMAVSEAAEGDLVESNHVYVIAPNTILTIAKGRLHLAPRNSVAGLPAPIDDFFYSLAEDQGANAIGICLSGSGTDGALGIQAIKSEGGITFAQDKASAQFASMPHAAAELGYADFILPPAGIAEALVRINSHPLWRSPSIANIQTLNCDDESMGTIFQLLNKSCNMDFTNYKSGTIKRRLARRLALLNLYNISDYIQLLDTNPEELQNLCQDFLIRVTSFFRDAEVFDNFNKIILPVIIDTRPPKAPLRIWVPGCSTGEEVYSIAICCIEYLMERGISTQIQIFGTDVSDSALRTARAGIYVENVARNISPERLKKFFTKNGTHYEVAKSVRDLCVFARHDVTTDPPFSRLDLISCRNLLIYLDPLLQKRVLPLFHYALKPNGVLILGLAENIGGFADIFAPGNSKEVKFYTKKSLPERAQLKYLDGFMGKTLYTSASTPRSLPLKKQYTEFDRQKREADRVTVDRYVPPAVLCNKSLNVLEFRGNTSLYLTQPSGPPDTNLQRLAPPSLFIEISKAVHKADKDNAIIRRENLRVETFMGDRVIALEVVPIRPIPSEETLFLVFFGEKTQPGVSLEAQGLWTVLGRYVRHTLGNKLATQHSNDDALIQSKRDLDDTRDHIRIMTDEYEATKEELQASQEELLSSNEEFQSANEELETAKEELQSANEELLTTNDEIRQRNNDLNELNDKLKGALTYAEAIIKTVSQPFLVLDERLHILQANPAFYTTFQTTPEATEHHLLYDLGDRQWDIPELRQFLKSLLLKDTSFKDYEITHVFPNVGSKTMRLNGTHLIWQGQMQILLAIEDVSGYRNALDTLKDNDRHKDEFLAMLAHELRNPLAPIRNALEILKDHKAGKDAEEEACTIMERQLQKIVRLVDDLLDVARITRGVVVLKKDPIDLVQLVNQTAESVRPHFDVAHHELNLTLPKEKIFVKGDSIRLEQVVTNLLINAAKYTEAGGHISVTLAREDGSAVLRVVDDGVGISPQLLPYIFDLFVQAERSLDRKQGGLGIGLTLVRRLVELQGGTVMAKSGGLRKGSEFIVRLPVVSDAEIKNLTAPPVTHKKETFVKRRILVIDDNADAAKTIRMLLELQGHSVETALDGPSGILIAQAFKPEVILLDIGLPGMDGYEVARCLRELPETKNILLIALSGYGQTEDFRKSREAGFDHHLVKPANMHQLQTLISG